MGGGIRKGIVILLALFCLSAPAMSEETGIAITAEMRLTNAPDMGKDALAAVNGLLERLAFSVQAGEDAGRIAVLSDGTEIFSAAVRSRDGYTLTAFGPEGNAYLTGPGEKDALALLTGAGDADLPPVLEWAGSYPALAEKLFGVLGRNCAPRTEKQRTSIKNTAGSAAFVTYAFRADALTDEIWEEVLEEVLPLLRKTLGDREDLYESAESVLEELIFSGGCTFKRFLDKDGADMGMQFTGTAAWRRDKRKVTLFFGYTPGKGGYFSLRLPAVRGENDLHIVLDYAEAAQGDARTWTLSAAFERTYGEEKNAAKLDAALKSVDRDGGEEWTGRIAWSRTENKKRIEWTLTPRLVSDGETLTGAVGFARQEGKKDPAKGEITLQIRRGDAAGVPDAAPEDARDLRGMPEEEARAAVQAEWTYLARAAARLMKTLPEEERALITHALRTETWMYGPDASPLPEGDAWTVKEETKE
ncbi:MAG: hypothetical protein J5472_00735 [Clostridia bacterium]|nr:hypothetical protein [Clostridia bacterium]